MGRIISDSYESVKALLEQGHANANARNVFGRLPMCKAVENGKEMVELLLNHNAKVDSYVLSVADYIGDPSIIEMLEARFADQDTQIVEEEEGDVNMDEHEENQGEGEPERSGNQD